MTQKPPLHIRPAVNEDYEFIRQIVSVAHKASEPWALSWSPAILEGELRAAECFVAVTSEKVGFVCLRPPGPAWEINLIAVAPSFRGRGYLKEFVEQLSLRIQADRRFALSDSIDLEVRADNRAAIRAYEKCGFQHVGLRPRYYRDGEDAILFRRTVGMSKRA